MISNVWVYFPNLFDDQTHDLSEATPELTQVSPQLYTMNLNLDDVEMTPLSYYELYQNDFDTHVVMVMIHDTGRWLDPAWITEHIKTLKGNFYTLESFLYHMLLKNPKMITSIKTHLLTLLEKEYIDSCVTYAKYAMNATETSKQLYIHRNTLQYRFKVIEEKTGLNPKNFETIAIFHACFN